MARSEARLQFGMWTTGLDGASPNAKLLYCVLLTEPTLNHSGVGALRTSRWAKHASLSMEETETALAELCEGQWVFIDGDTEEVFVRTLIRNDGVADQPYVLKGALREAVLTASPRIRHALAGELRRLPPRPPDGVSKAGKKVTYPDPHATADVLDPPSPKPSGNGSERVSGGAVDPSETLHGGGGGGGVGGGTSSSGATYVQGSFSSANANEEQDSAQGSFDEIDESIPTAQPKTTAKPKPADKNDRPDIDQLVNHLADLVEVNIETRPTITKNWRTAARLLLDKDLVDEPKPLDLAMRLAAWATNDEFWRQNIQSMPTFRAQFRTLRLRARSEWQKNQRIEGKRTTDDKRAAVNGLVAQVLGANAMQPDLRSIQGGRS